LLHGVQPVLELFALLIKKLNLLLSGRNSLVIPTFYIRVNYIPNNEPVITTKRDNKLLLIATRKVLAGRISLVMLETARVPYRERETMLSVVPLKKFAPLPAPFGPSRATSRMTLLTSILALSEIA
jgi:hypothetical protein